MTVKEWLQRAKKLDEEIDELIKAQEQALTAATSVTCGTGEKVQTSNVNTSEGKFINYASYSEMIDNRIDELYAIKQEILQAINLVDDATLRTLLIARYINFGTWEQIAVDLHYSYVHIVHNLHPKSLKAISEIVNSI
jgi:hypothetical protein